MERTDPLAVARGISASLAIVAVAIGLALAWGHYTPARCWAGAFLILTGGLWLARIIHVTKGGTR